MHKFLLRPAFAMLTFAAACQVQAQSATDPGAYMSYIRDQQREITKDLMSYSSAVAHGKSARKVENRRKELMQTLTESQRKIGSMAPFQGDKSLRDSTSKYLLTSYHVLNEDYGKIVNLEEVAEQSYDAMEAYLLAQEIAGDKLEQAGERLETTERSFAASHYVQLVEGTKDELTEKMEQANQVNEYHRTVYLIFFKSYKQEMYLMDAVQNKNINAIEQNKNTLSAYAQEGLTKLNALKDFSGDRSLLAACRKVMEFHQVECKDNITTFTDFYLKEENFNKVKKAFEAKRERERTQADVDQYNKAINDIDQAGNTFNATNKRLFEIRKEVIENWNKSSQAFLDKHVPKYK